MSRTRIQRRAVRSDCKLDRLMDRMANEYGLPREALKIVLPGGRKARKDKRLGELRRDYGWCDAR